jgi:L-lactate utilization protein LutC
VAGALLSRFSTALEAVGGRAHITSRDGLGAALRGLLVADARVLVSPSLAPLAAELVAAGVDARVGTTAGLADASTGQPVGLEEGFRRADAAVTDSLTGVAALGTVVIGAKGGNEGLLSCLPTHHVVILEGSSLQETLGQALQAVFREFADHAGEFVFVTGPSRTADIEMMTVLGVHGPVRLDVLVVDDEGDA